MKISAVILLFDLCCRNPDLLSIIYFPKSEGAILLWGKIYYIVDFPPGAKATI
jgi:hypothetical protein